MEITKLKVESRDFEVGKNGVVLIEKIANQIGENTYNYVYLVIYEDGSSYSVNITHPYCEVWKSAPRDEDIPSLESILKMIKQE